MISLTGHFRSVLHHTTGRTRPFAELTNRKLCRTAHPNVELEADIRDWINEWNANPKPFAWAKIADEILNNPRPILPANQ